MPRAAQAYFASTPCVAARDWFNHLAGATSIIAPHDSTLNRGRVRWPADFLLRWWKRSPRFAYSLVIDTTRWPCGRLTAAAARLPRPVPGASPRIRGAYLRSELRSELLSGATCRPRHRSRICPTLSARVRGTGEEEPFRLDPARPTGAHYAPRRDHPVPRRRGGVLTFPGTGLAWSRHRLSRTALMDRGAV